MKNNVHKNHRQRLYETISKIGLENVNEFIALEFILTYLIPRKDTNPIAHKLIEKFGDIASVIDAPENELAKIDGIGLRTAKLLNLLPDIFLRYQIEKKSHQKYIKTNKDIINYVGAFLKNKPVEEFYLICLDARNKILLNQKISQGGLMNVCVDTKLLTSSIVNTKNVKGVIIAHCHPESSCAPSFSDMQSTEKIEEITKLVGVNFIDHIIVGTDGYYSFLRMGKINK